MKPLVSTSCRRFVLHTGPTNSGKTRAALDKLVNAKSGVYGAPLRLLAQEAFSSLNEKGVPTSLLTGQQRIDVPGAKHLACTIEMLPTHEPYDMAVIDEIQLLGDSDRGFAWSRALLDAQVKEMVLCGSSNSAPLVRRIVESPSRAVQEVSFERLNKLLVEDSVTQGFVPGDCVIAFSRRELYSLKLAIEQSGLRCNIIYGALPPEERLQQANQFNLGNSVLVASDAVGLGLNLAIRRIVFSTVEKFDGIERRRLSSSEVKQIAGRAGRGRGDVGLVNALNNSDRMFLKNALAQELPAIEKAGWLPSLNQLLLLGGGDVADNAPLSELLDLFVKENANLPPLEDFFLCNMDDMIAAAEQLDAEAPNLALETRYMWSIAPVDMDDEVCRQYFVLYARQMDAVGKVKLLVKIHEAKELRPPVSDELRNAAAARISRLESLYGVLDLYAWLKNRFGSESFPDNAEDVRMACTEEIGKLIRGIGYRPPSKGQKKAQRKNAVRGVKSRH